jgi:hypothetical protein
MEYPAGRGKMKQETGWMRIIIFFMVVSSCFGQSNQHFYNVDKEVRVEGAIQKIIMEPRYKDTAPFLVVVLEEKNTNKIYTVEISPVWFFDHDFHQGEDLAVTGSLYISGENNLNIIAREVQSRGEILILRDKHGFPNWQGGKGQMPRKGKRKGKRY